MADFRMIFREFRENRRQEAMQRQRQEAVQALLGSRGPSAFGEPDNNVRPPMAGTGLLADPSDFSRQVEFAAGLEGLGAGQGVGLLGQVLGNQLTRESVADQLAQSERESLRRANTQRSNAELQAEVSRGNALLAAQAQLGAAEIRAGADSTGLAGTTQGGMSIGNVPAGSVMTTTPRGLEVIPLPGTAEYNKGRDSVEGFTRAVAMFDQFTDIIRQSGTEFLPTTEASTLTSLRQGILSEVGKLMELGVLQKDDLARVESALPDPTSLVSNLFRFDSNIVTAYTVFRDQLADQLEDWTQRTLYWPNIGEVAMPVTPPGFEPVQEGR